MAVQEEKLIDLRILTTCPPFFSALIVPCDDVIVGILLLPPAAGVPDPGGPLPGGGVRHRPGQEHGGLPVRGAQQGHPRVRKA